MFAVGKHKREDVFGTPLRVYHRTICVNRVVVLIYIYDIVKKREIESTEKTNSYLYIRIYDVEDDNIIVFIVTIYK